MSKITDGIKAKLTGKRKVILPKTMAVEKNIRVTHDRFSYEYRVGIEWGFKAFLDNTIHVDAVIDNCARQFREDMYGDIRNRILALERAVLEDDRDMALTQMRDIMREIFG